MLNAVCFHPRGKVTVLDLLPISIIWELGVNLSLCQEVPQITHTTRAKAHLTTLEFFTSCSELTKSEVRYKKMFIF